MPNDHNLKKNKYGFYQINPTPSNEVITKFYALFIICIISEILNVYVVLVLSIYI